MVATWIWAPAWVERSAVAEGCRTHRKAQRASSSRSTSSGQHVALTAGSESMGAIVCGFIVRRVFVQTHRLRPAVIGHGIEMALKRIV